MKALVVVGVDGSATSQCALEWALSTAERHHVPVEAVHVWQRHHPALDLVVPDRAASVATAARQRVESQMARALEDRVQGALAVEATPRTVEGDPAVALVTAAADACLLVLGRHGEGTGRGRGPRTSLGVIASHCLRYSSTPVAIVPRAAAAAAPARVVVGVDGSTSSTSALRWAVLKARLTGAPVVAVLAQELTTVPDLASVRTHGPSASLADRKGTARTALEAAVQQALGVGGAARVQQVLLHREAVGGLLDLVRANDLLVLGRRGRGGFERLLLGSVSQQCAERAPCPVVIVPERTRIWAAPDSA